MSTRIGAVATSHHLATEAGAAMLRAGGNAIDAAIAAAAALCVVYPNNVALGGDLVALVRNPDGEIHFVNATGRAPAAQTLDVLRAHHGEALPNRGIDTVTVPGGVRGWEALAELGGRLGWGERLGAARRLAREGAPTATSVARAIRDERAALEADPGCRALFLPGGTPLDEGAPLVQPALADTFDRLAEHGPDEFYSGEVAARWIAGLEALGGRITAADAAGYRPVVEAPLRIEALGVEVVTSPPNTQGFSLLRTVRGIADRGLRDPLGDDAAELAELFHSANAVRAAWLCDPDVAPLDGAGLVTVDTPGRETDARPAHGDTVGLTAVSADGWAVSLVQSVYWTFGACVLEPSTGILFQNRGTSFSLDREHPAAFGPGLRPPHTLMPVLVLRDGELLQAQATMGGQAQPQIHAQLLLRSLGGASALEATSAPRWVVGVQDDGDTAATITVEADVPERAVRTLRAAGRFSVKQVRPRDEALGHSNLIRPTADGFDAASDPRSDGSAIVVDAEVEAGTGAVAR
ncbi:gamma-glutamyltransferase [Agromyces endophyticus]|uniref:gamma-glutamyltransferase family protein n=1 Tax=Agromyces sp. H17E-10 TaxID=2932244 RepID=UPI001FD1D7BD|nr:gamma-glutamyltransferase [Agromyces sp. H17E-10]UOQ87604.1 gamma-glutamyltransferase [Agromyces sp. H17E-10]